MAEIYIKTGARMRLVKLLGEHWELSPQIMFPSLPQYNSLQTEMSTLYSTAKICDYKNPSKCDLELEPGECLSDLTRPATF